ncbi:MAG: hypothetical protein ACE5GM_05840 [bacterium]
MLVNRQGGVFITLLLVLAVLLGGASVWLYRVWGRLQAPLPALADNTGNPNLAYKQLKQKMILLEKNPLIHEMSVSEQELTAWIIHSQGFMRDGAFNGLSLKIKKDEVVARFIFSPYRCDLKNDYSLGMKLLIKSLRRLRIRRIYLKLSLNFQISRGKVYLLPKELRIGEVKTYKTLLLLASNAAFSDLLEFTLPPFIKDCQPAPGEILLKGAVR